MKRLFLSLVALAAVTMSYAQNTLVATLTHGDEITMFYGVDAFKNAHAAAVDGDIINLSGGKFNATTITKGITIRGTGVQDANPTYITNSVEIRVLTDATNKLNIEGCYFTDYVYAYSINGAYFLKNSFCSFNVFGSVQDATFVNCVVVKDLYYNSNQNSTIQFINSLILNPHFNGNGIDKVSTGYINCVILPSSGFYASYIKNSKLVNCILYYTSTSVSANNHMLPATTSAWNCVAIGAGRQDVYNNTSSPQDCKYATKDIFIDGSYEKDLTDEAKQTYLGNDGTPVGMYGGPFPYSMTPTYPTITKMNVANRTTADGKLSVEIEVSATE